MLLLLHVHVYTSTEQVDFECVFTINIPVLVLTSLQAPAASVPPLAGGGEGKVLPRDEEIHLHSSPLSRSRRCYVRSAHHLPQDDQQKRCRLLCHL